MFVGTYPPIPGTLSPNENAHTVTYAWKADKVQKHNNFAELILP